MDMANMRSLVARGLIHRRAFRRALLEIAPAQRDAWLDLVLGLGEIEDDGPDLPRDCVPYLPCEVDALVRLADEASIGPSDVFVDVGSGVGRAVAFIHLLTGAAAIGIEIQRGLAQAFRHLSARLPMARMGTIEGDASTLTGRVMIGTVFFLYCPFSGRRLEYLVDELELLAATRPVRICSVDLPLPERPWLAREPQLRRDLAVYRTTRHAITRPAPGNTLKLTSPMDQGTFRS